jgi:hypothetical protein
MNGNNASIVIKRLGLMPMPVDVLITYKDGTQNCPFYEPDVWRKTRRKQY